MTGTARIGRRVAPMVVVALVSAAMLVAVLIAGDDTGENGRTRSAESTETTSSDVHDHTPSLTDERFTLLSAARSNRCDLRAGELRKMPDDKRLQGSCCFPMDRHRYQEQLDELRAHPDRHLIPANPYDVPVTLAKRLLGYRDLPLDRSQRAAYDRAVRISELGGPCCCPCWRADAFEGQARFLISRRDYTAEQVANLWELEEGCGGEDHQHG